MKKAMLLIAALMFAFGANAAIVTVDEAFISNATFDSVINKDASLVFAEAGTEGGPSIITDDMSVLEEDTAVDVDWSVNPDLSATILNAFSEGDFDSDFNTSSTGTDILTTSFLLADETYLFDMAGFERDVLKPDLSMKAVFVPTALWLFVPALIGFFGLRRIATAIVAARSGLLR